MAKKKPNPRKPTARRKAPAKPPAVQPDPSPAPKKKTPNQFKPGNQAAVGNRGGGRKSLADKLKHVNFIDANVESAKNVINLALKRDPTCLLPPRDLVKLSMWVLERKYGKARQTHEVHVTSSELDEQLDQVDVVWLEESAAQAAQDDEDQEPDE